MWQDEKRTPGPWAQTHWAPVIVVLALLAGAAVGKIHDHLVIGGFVVLMDWDRSGPPRA